MLPSNTRLDKDGRLVIASGKAPEMQPGRLSAVTEPEDPFLLHWIPSQAGANGVEDPQGDVPTQESTKAQIVEVALTGLMTILIELSAAIYVMV